MSKKILILGYTRTGKAVLLPTCSPNKNNGTKFEDWTRGDHYDTSRILKEHGERESDHKIGSWCARWARLHADESGATSRRTHIRGATETNIRPVGSHRSKRR